MGFVSNAIRLLAKKRVWYFLKKGSIIDRSVVLSHADKIRIGFRVQINNYSVLKPQEGWIEIGDYVIIGENCVLYGNNSITIGEKTIVAPGVMLMAGGHHLGRGSFYFNNPKKDSGITIGRNVWVGANATILSGLSIGDNSVVGAGSVVTKNVPANVVVVGCPAVIKKRIGDF